MKRIVFFHCEAIFIHALEDTIYSNPNTHISNVTLYDKFTFNIALKKFEYGSVVT